MNQSKPQRNSYHEEDTFAHTSRGNAATDHQVGSGRPAANLTGQLQIEWPGAIGRNSLIQDKQDHHEHEYYYADEIRGWQEGTGQQSLLHPKLGGALSVGVQVPVTQP